MRSAVFLLDAYDELQAQYLWKNLYRSNQLDIYRKAGAQLARGFEAAQKGKLDELLGGFV